MTESDDTNYPIGRGEVIPHPPIQRSNKLCTGRYQNAKFHISRQTITRLATEYDLIRPRTSVHPRTRVRPPQFVPYAPGVFIDPACLGRASEINGFMPQGPFGQHVPDIHTITTRHIPLRMDSPEIPSRGLDGPDEPTRERDDYLVSPVVGIDTLSVTRDGEGATPEADLISTPQSELHFIKSSGGRSHSYSAVGA